MEAEACASACLMGNPGSDKLELMLAPYARKVEADLQLWLVDDGVPASLAEAMRYCMLGGGKRLRPALVYLAARAAGGSEDDEHVRRSAAAIEMVHTYSLVHDDLPAMDDDSLRRGQPTAHVKFGQAMAILAGDALLTRAFGVLAEGPAGGPVAELTGELASAAGATGMIAGQVADMALCEVPAGLDGLQYIHMRKTAALIRSAARMGAICAKTAPRDLAALSEYGRLLGLAFQLVDDLLDATGQTKKLGKTAGKDAQAGKKTHLSQIGLDAARKLGEELSAQAVSALGPMGVSADPLRRLAELLSQRTH